jgi:hypothetical protein
VNLEEKVTALGLEIEAIKSQFAYLNARINLMETRVQTVSVPVYDYDNLPKDANSTQTD